MIEFLDSIPLLAPVTQPLAYAMAAGVIGLLWWLRTRHLPWRAQAGVVAAGLTLSVVAWLVVDVWWRPVAEGLGRNVWVWVAALCVVAVQAAIGRRGGGLGSVLARLLAVGAMLLAALVGINAHLAAFPTVAAALGLNVRVSPFSEFEDAAGPLARRPDGPLERSWVPPAEMPASGRVLTAPIASSDPGFHPREAYLYLPPAYLTANRPVLPVLVLMAGQPGEPLDWFTAGRLKATMDAYAQAHQGLAPVVVVPDPLGSATANPLCSDAHLGKVATYLQHDVPAWITANLKVDPDHKRWAVAGLSNGGTCALQLVTRAPEVYPTFLDMSGELHPTLGSEQATIDTGFGGDRAAYEANDPWSLMSRQQYPGVTGLFSAGRGDGQFLPAMQQLQESAVRAGMTTELRLYEGGHNWVLWAAAMADQVDWLGDRLGITA